MIKDIFVTPNKGIKFVPAAELPPPDAMDATCHRAAYSGRLESITLLGLTYRVVDAPTAA